MTDKKYNSGNRFCHTKTGKIYTFCREIINVTYANDGQVMMMYSRGNEFFVREKEEFLTKFVKIIEENVIVGNQYK